MVRTPSITAAAMVGFAILIFVGQSGHAQQPKNCSFEWPGLFREYPKLRSAMLETPTRNPDNWRSGWNYEHIFDVVRDTLRDFKSDQHLYKDFEKICVYALDHHDGVIGDGVAGVALMWKAEGGMIHRRIYYNPNQGSAVRTMWLFLHELGHHIASYVDGTFSTADFSVGRQHNMHVMQRMADFWAGAILYRLNEAEPGRYDLDSLFRTWGRRGYSNRFISTADTMFAMRKGWLHSEYSDTPWWYYGVYDEPWVYQCPHNHPAVLASTDPNVPIIRI